MNLKEQYSKYQKDSSKLSFYVLLIATNAIVFLMVLLFFFWALDIIFLIFLLISIIAFIIIFFLTYRLNKILKITYEKLEKIKLENSCIFTNKIKMSIPNQYNIINYINTNDGFKLYKCKNQDVDYTFLEQAVKNIDYNNNMLTLIEFTDLFVNSVVTVEYIMKNGLCVIKDNDGNLSLTDLENITLRR